MLVRDRLFIGGRWVAPSGSEMIDVHNAGTGEVMGRVPAGSAKDVDAAVAAARGALDKWSATSPGVRSELLEKISAGLRHAPTSWRKRSRRKSACRSSSPGASRPGCR